jgi:hypothetical protein
MTDKAQQISQVLSLMEGGSSERSACETVGINRATFRSGVLRHNAADHYARALEGLALDQVEKLEATIQDMRDGTLDPAIGRIEVDARKWFASKFLPKRFGDKIEQTVQGADGGPVQTETKLDLSALSAEQLRALASIKVTE